MFVALMDTEHYSWVASGPTADAAVAWLAAGWDAHMKDRIGAGVDGTLAWTGREAVEHYEPTVLDLGLGMCYRDHTRLVP